MLFNFISHLVKTCDW